MKTIGRNKKKAEEMCRSEGEGEEYLSEGEDGRPCIKWRRQQKTNTTGSKEETVGGEEKGIGREKKAEEKEYRDTETEGLIREYQKNSNLTQQ